MEKQDIINKLKELGIQSENCYPKKSFIDSDLEEAVVGLFKTEFASDFYFYVPFEKKLFVLKKTDIEQFKHEIFMGKTKYIVPLSKCEVVWEDKPLEDIELPDENFSMMTLRHYSCIHLKVPKSGLGWLDELIKESQRNIQNCEIVINKSEA